MSRQSKTPILAMSDWIVPVAVLYLGRIPSGKIPSDIPSDKMLDKIVLDKNLVDDDAPPLLQPPHTKLRKR